MIVLLLFKKVYLVLYQKTNCYATNKSIEASAMFNTGS